MARKNVEGIDAVAGVAWIRVALGQAPRVLGGRAPGFLPRSCFSLAHLCRDRRRDLARRRDRPRALPATSSALAHRCSGRSRRRPLDSRPTSYDRPRAPARPPSGRPAAQQLVPVGPRSNKLRLRRGDRDPRAAAPTRCNRPGSSDRVVKALCGSALPRRRTRRRPLGSRSRTVNGKARPASSYAGFVSASALTVADFGGKVAERVPLVKVPASPAPEQEQALDSRPLSEPPPSAAHRAKKKGAPGGNLVSPRLEVFSGSQEAACEHAESR
jgi:hypothetical protein